MNSRKVVLSVCAVLMTIGVMPSYGASQYPDFSWDTVPKYMHVRKVTAFTDEELDYLAQFPLITLEKTTGLKRYGSTEAGTLKAAQAIKRKNRDAKILYYRNIIVHYSMYEADEDLERIKGGLLTDKKGSTKLVRQRVPAYDLSNKKIQSWWLKSANDICKSRYIDGLFVDGNIKALDDGYLRKVIGSQKKDDVIEGYHVIMHKLAQTLGKKKLIIANVIRARFDDAGLEFMKYFDGSYIEGFEHAVKGRSREDYIADGLDAIQKAARKGNIIAFTCGAGGYTDTDMDEESDVPDNASPEARQARLTYTLALFLSVAEEHSYFMFSDGYGVDNGRNKHWMKDPPEYSRPLGPPKGLAKRKGYVYTREFKYASVWLDIENETAEITWK